jgi:hypothetical protein
MRADGTDVQQLTDNQWRGRHARLAAGAQGVRAFNEVTATGAAAVTLARR